MQLTDIIKRVQRIFGDDDEVQIKIADIISWVSDGQMEIARQTECLTKDKLFDFDPYTFTGFELPADFIMEKRIAYYPRGFAVDKGNECPLAKTTLEHLDQFLANPRASDEQVTQYYFWANKLMLYPTPANTAVAQMIKLWYVCAPDPLSQMTDQIQIPQTMHEDLVRYALIRARELNEDVEQAASMQNDLNTRLMQSRSEAFNPFKDQYPVIRDYAGDMW